MIFTFNNERYRLIQNFHINVTIEIEFTNFRNNFYEEAKTCLDIIVMKCSHALTNYSTGKTTSTKASPASCPLLGTILILSSQSPLNTPREPSVANTSNTTRKISKKKQKKNEMCHQIVFLYKINKASKFREKVVVFN